MVYLYNAWNNKYDRPVGPIVALHWQIMRFRVAAMLIGSSGADIMCHLFAYRSMITVVLDSRGVSFAVLVQAKARRETVVGEHGGALKVAVRAPAEAGRANRAVVDLLARTFEVPTSAVEIISGLTSRTKRVRIATTQPQKLVARLRTEGG